MFQKENKASNWNIKLEHIVKVYKQHNVTISAEIGIARGGMSHYLLSHMPNIEHHGIDPFLGGYDELDIFSEILSQYTQNGPSSWVDAILYEMKDFGCRFQLHQNLSSAAVFDFEPESLDAIYIDGDHTYEGIVTDIKAYAPIVRVGGIIGFDDVEEDFPGVLKATTLFVNANNLVLIPFNGKDKRESYVIKNRKNLDTSMF